MRKHVLVVEDDKNLLATMEFILEAANYQVTLVEDGQKALKQILDYRNQKIAVDVLVTDIRMPRMGGLELLSRLSKEGIKIPTLVVTNHGSEELRKQLATWDCIECLEKPLDDEQILKHIALLLQNCT